MSSIRIKELETENNWRIIDLSHNLIKSVDSPELLTKQIQLETIRLNFNSEFNGTFAHKTLKNFECGNCGFTEIQSQHFEALHSLERLDLKANKINRINEGAFKSNEKLKSVDLTGNRLKIVPPTTFDGLRDFEALYLTMNSIELTENKPFLKSKSLKHLRINECSISSIHEQTFSELHSLESLNLNRNEIQTLPTNSFKFNAKLKSLSVENNRLRFFLSLDSLKQLNELCIDNNSFVDNPEFSQLVKKYTDRNLRTLNCNDNVGYFIENLFAPLTVTDVPVIVQEQNSTEMSGKFVSNLTVQGISDFFIGSYITIFLMLQALAFVLLSLYLIKITKYEKLEGDVNYANTILNDDEIYKVYKSNE